MRAGGGGVGEFVLACVLCVWGTVCLRGDVDVWWMGGVREESVLYRRAVHVLFVKCVEGICKRDGRSREEGAREVR